MSLPKSVQKALDDLHMLTATGDWYSLIVFHDHFEGTYVFNCLRCKENHRRPKGHPAPDQCAFCGFKG